MSMKTTRPAPPEIVDIDQPIPYALTPLARAALANGVAFEDVDAYVSSAHSRNRPIVIDQTVERIP